MSTPEKKIVTDRSQLSGQYRIVTSSNGYRHDSGWMTKKTLYRIQSVTLGTDTPARGSVERRYKEFDALYNALVAKYGHDVIPEFLVGRNKLLEDHFTYEFCQARQLLLIDWLNRTININFDIQNDDLITEFLKLTRSTAGDEKLANGGQGTRMGTGESQITQIFSVTNKDRVELTEADRQYLPTEGIMGVYRVTDDDL
jgi:hypothetical protein